MKYIVEWCKFHIEGIVLTSFVVLLVFILGRNLNITSRQMFTFHDETQAARVQQFALSLQNFQIPPRIAPEFSYGMGYPVFNFYAPFAYWVTSILSVLGLSTTTSLKFSFLLAIIVGFLGMFMLLRKLFNGTAGLFGGALYITSIFVPVEIFVRGNLSEMWFIAVFPFALFLLIKNSEISSRKIFVSTVIILSFLFTVHNVFSLISIGLVLGFIVLLKEKKKNLLAFSQALLLASYFIIPALLESHITYASIIATKTSYADNFLCLKQLWTGPQGGWGFGGSVPGCEFDGMSFALGKPQILFGLLGGIVITTSIFRKKTIRRLDQISRIVVAILLLTLISLFLTLYQSQFVWNIFSPILALFQFPWRFLVFGFFGLAFIGGYGMYVITKKWNNHVYGTNIVSLLIFGVSILCVFSVQDLFRGQSMSNTLYESKYLSSDYIHNSVAYKIPEYLPKYANYDIWRSYEDKNTVPYSEGLFVKNNLNIHYFPYWKIRVNGRDVVPHRFDDLGRPLLEIAEGSHINVTYSQTPIEQFGNVVTLIALVLMGVTTYKPIWTKIQKIKN